MIKNWAIRVERKRGGPIGFFIEATKPEADELLDVLRELLEAGDIKDFDIDPVRVLSANAARNLILGAGGRR